jgi:tetratricopeptide (TPR) repeat protein
MASGRYDDVLQWSERSLGYINTHAEPAILAMSYFMLGAGGSQGGRPLSEVETHLKEAMRLADLNNLPNLAGRSRFEIGNMLAQRGDLDGALRAYGDAIELARQAGDPGQEILAQNNFAYHSLLLGDLPSAHEHIDTALTLSEEFALQMPRQYLYSTRGEVALAEKQWEEAESWFHRGISEAEKSGNMVQVANYRANLGLTAQGRGELDAALLHFESALQTLNAQIAPFLQVQIHLWLTDLYMLRGERAAAEQSLHLASDLILEKGYQRLQSTAEKMRQTYRLK